MKSTIGKTILELVLWNVSNVLCLLIPSAAVFFIGKEFLHWGPGFLSFYMTATVLATLTWGSWAALVWTKNRALRGGMQATTLLPGIITVIAGGFGFWVGFGAWYLWLGMVAAGIGMVAAAVALVRYFRPVTREPGAASYVFGLGVYPLMTTALSLGIGSMWYNYVTSPAGDDWRNLDSIATLYVTVIALALVSTVIPAAVSSGLRKFSADVVRR
jgi:hypothetical protein